MALIITFHTVPTQVALQLAKRSNAYKRGLLYGFRSSPCNTVGLQSLRALRGPSGGGVWCLPGQADWHDVLLVEGAGVAAPDMVRHRPGRRSHPIPAGSAPPLGAMLFFGPDRDRVAGVAAAVAVPLSLIAAGRPGAVGPGVDVGVLLGGTEEPLERVEPVHRLLAHGLQHVVPQRVGRCEKQKGSMS